MGSRHRLPLTQAGTEITAWKEDYNQNRPHSTGQHHTQ
ncbi:integrase core domain-containing protein [Rhizobium leguminosarum]|nr:transposase [Rhizobium leguminosarum]